MVNIEEKQNGTSQRIKQRLPVCVVSQLKGRSMLKGVSVMGAFSKNGLTLRITSPSGQAVLEFGSNALNKMLSNGVGSEFHGHRSTGYLLSSHPAVVGNLFRDLGIIVTPECIQVLQTRLANHEQLHRASSSKPESPLTDTAFDVNPKPAAKKVDKIQSPPKSLNFTVRSTLMRDSALGKTA